MPTHDSFEAAAGGGVKASRPPAAVASSATGGAALPYGEWAAGSRYPRPTLRDWLLLAISVIFVAGGALILNREPKVGIITLAFFGSCAAVHGSTILQKFRFQRFDAVGIDVIGGVPIRPPKARFLLLLGEDYPLLFRVLAGFTAAAGGLLVCAVLAGRFPRQFLQFDPDALTIGQGRWRARIPWDTINGLGEANWQTNPVLLIGISGFDAIEVEPPAETGQVFAVLHNNQALAGFMCFTVMPATFGIDLPVLTAAIARYVADASARHELGRRSIASPAGD